MEDIKKQAIDIVSKLLKEEKITSDESRILLEAIICGGGNSGVTFIQTPQAPHIVPDYMPEIKSPEKPWERKIYCENRTETPTGFTTTIS